MVPCVTLALSILELIKSVHHARRNLTIFQIEHYLMEVQKHSVQIATIRLFLFAADATNMQNHTHTFKTKVYVKNVQLNKIEFANNVTHFSLRGEEEYVKIAPMIIFSNARPVHSLQYSLILLPHYFKNFLHG